MLANERGSTKSDRRSELSLPEIDRLEQDLCLTLWGLTEVQRKILDQRIILQKEQDTQAQLLSTMLGASAFRSLTLSCRIGNASLTYLGRKCPELPCDVVFADHDWKPAWQIVKKQPPPTPPPLAEFVCILVTLGGYNNRKHDAPLAPNPLDRTPPHDRLQPRLARLPRRGAGCVVRSVVLVRSISRMLAATASVTCRGRDPRVPTLQ